jgi:hypothetical protein
MYASEFNARYPKGTKIKYWPRGKNSHDKPVETAIRRAAYYLGSGTMVIPLENGKTAKLTEIEPVLAEQKASPVAISSGTIGGNNSVNPGYSGQLLNANFQMLESNLVKLVQRLGGL